MPRGTLFPYCYYYCEFEIAIILRQYQQTRKLTMQQMIMNEILQSKLQSLFQSVE